MWTRWPVPQLTALFSPVCFRVTLVCLNLQKVSCSQAQHLRVPHLRTRPTLAPTRLTETRSVGPQLVLFMPPTGAMKPNKALPQKAPWIKDQPLLSTLLQLRLLRAVPALSVPVPLRMTLQRPAQVTPVQQLLVPQPLPPHRLPLLSSALCAQVQLQVLFVTPCNQVIHQSTLILILPALRGQRLVLVLVLVALFLPRWGKPALVLDSLALSELMVVLKDCLCPACSSTHKQRGSLRPPWMSACPRSRRRSSNRGGLRRRREKLLGRRRQRSLTRH